MKNSKLRPMTKLLVYAASLLLTSHVLTAQDTSRAVRNQQPQHDTSSHPFDTTGRTITDTTKAAKPANATMASQHDTTAPKQKDDIKLIVDKSTPPQVSTNEDYDPRWFISPLFKFQLQDYGMLEKNHFGYLSDANDLPILDRSTISASLSAYKNITGRLSASADIGLAYGHVTSTDVLVASTRPQSFNLLDLTAYYHLLPGRYKLQPFVSVGIHDLINNQSYLTVPMNVGVKFHSRKIMALVQAGYGYGASRNNASTVMYTACLYVPVNFKKKKPQDESQLSKSDPSSLAKKDSDKTKKTDSTSKQNSDSLSKDSAANNSLNSKKNSLSKAQVDRSGSDAQDARDASGKHASSKSLEDNDVSGGGNGKGSHAKKKDDRYDDDQYNNDDPDGDNANGSKKGLKAFNYDDFSKDDFEMDTVDGKPIVKFVVYFEFNQYDLNSSAFSRIDKVIARMRRDHELLVSIKGFTDDVGTPDYNMMLSKKRAQIVYDYMNSRGIPSDCMTSRFYGKENPVADNKDPNTAWLNRRAELYVYEKGTHLPNVILPSASKLRK
jgi:outer membrane protein OmpA-like peptidoglycan-associated protein